MRLGQMARKLAISSSEIIQFLATLDILVVDNANTRLDDNQVDLLQRKFAPSIDFRSQSAILEPAAEIVAEIPSPESEPSTAANTIDRLEYDSRAETIKAPKIALSGLKVLGKIELPEPKKKDDDLPPPTQVAATDAANRPPLVERKSLPKKPVHHQRLYKNPVALQREKETQDDLDRRKEKADREKERKTQSYLNKVKLSPPTKAVRLVDEPVMQMTEAELKEEPKSWWRKFVKWIST